MKGRIRGPKPTGMNKLEASYAALLALMVRNGTILRFDFEPEKLRLADRTFYTPDFRVVMPDGCVEFHETKGHWEDDARVKIKVAAEMHPYTFKAIRWVKKQWEIETL